MANISPKTLFTGQRFIHLEEVESTNDFASQLLQKEKVNEGTVVFADSQVRGKGQYGNRWESEPNKNIAMSVIFYPHFLPVEKQFYLNQAVSLAIYDFIKSSVFLLRYHLKVKWPNDLLADGKKVAGILIENTLSGNKINSSVVGIGINIDQTRFSPEIQKVTSLKLIASKDYDVLDLSAGICECLESRYLQLKAGKEDLLKQDYLKVMYRFQKQSDFVLKDGVIKGRITGVEENGKLIVESGDKVFKFDFKEVRFGDA